MLLLDKILRAEPIISEEILPQLKERVAAIGDVTLAVIMVGDNPASRKYVDNKKKMCERVGVTLKEFLFEEETVPQKIYKTIQELNNDDEVNGIILQLPLPDHLKNFEKFLIESILPIKDVDGLTDYNSSQLYLKGKKANFIPCTPFGIVELLKGYNIPIENQNVVIVGRGKLVGKPLAQLMQSYNANVTVLHSKTSFSRMMEVFSVADIIVTCCSNPEYFGGMNWEVLTQELNKHVVVIDCSTNPIERDGKTIIVGDTITSDLVRDKNVFATTKVFGCVGPMTVISLIMNTVKAAEIQLEKY